MCLSLPSVKVFWVLSRCNPASICLATESHVFLKDNFVKAGHFMLTSPWSHLCDFESANLGDLFVEYVPECPDLSWEGVRRWQVLLVRGWKNDTLYEVMRLQHLKLTTINLTLRLAFSFCKDLPSWSWHWCHKKAGLDDLFFRGAHVGFSKSWLQNGNHNLT